MIRLFHFPHSPRSGLYATHPRFNGVWPWRELLRRLVRSWFCRHDYSGQSMGDFMPFCVKCGVRKDD